MNGLFGYADAFNFNRLQLVVGAVNRLYLLDSEKLLIVSNTTTGPLMDSPLCNPELSSCVGSRDSIVETDNHVKVLHYIRDKTDSSSGGRNQSAVVDGGGTLLVCGSTRQGVCELRYVNNLALRHRSHPKFGTAFRNVPVAANSPTASTVSLLDADGERLFIAASHTHDASPYREAFPAVATRLAPAGLLPINVCSEPEVYHKGMSIFYRRVA